MRVRLRDWLSVAVQDGRHRVGQALAELLVRTLLSVFVLGLTDRQNSLLPDVSTKPIDPHGGL